MSAAANSPSSVSGPGLAFSAMGIPEFQGDVALTTTAVVLVTDSGLTNGVRRIQVVNPSETETIALVYVPRGQAAGAEDVGDGIKILPGATYTNVIKVGVRVIGVASGAVSASVLVSDV